MCERERGGGGRGGKRERGGGVREGGKKREGGKGRVEGGGSEEYERSYKKFRARRVRWNLVQLVLPLDD